MSVEFLHRLGGVKVEIPKDWLAVWKRETYTNEKRSKVKKLEFESLRMKTQESQRCVLRMAHNHNPDDVAGDVAMVKTELRKTIQSRREAKGLGSVELPDEEETKSTELSAEEIEKINTRRERNRLSAQKCRKRRREQLVHLSQEAETIEEANSLLESEIEFLKVEREQLSRMLREHCCSMTRETSRCQNQRSGVNVS